MMMMMLFLIFVCFEVDNRYCRDATKKEERRKRSKENVDRLPQNITTRTYACMYTTWYHQEEEVS